MGVCCIVFDIDGMLFHAISKIKKKIGVKQKFRGGGGGAWIFFFLEKQFCLISCFMLFSTLQKIPLHSK